MESIQPMHIASFDLWHEDANSNKENHRQIGKNTKANEGMDAWSDLEGTSEKSRDTPT